MDLQASSSSRRLVQVVSSSPNPSSSLTSIFFGMIVLFLYVQYATSVYLNSPDGYLVSVSKDNVVETCSFNPVNALYFSIVTLCMIGYGDIVPTTCFNKFLTCVFVLVGFVIIQMELNRVFDILLDHVESSILVRVRAEVSPDTRSRKYIDFENDRMTNFFKGIVAFVVLFNCFVIEMLVLFCVEKLDVMDSLYLLVMSATTVGYGDKSFKTCFGRGFASVLLLFSTFTVANMFLFFIKMMINQRQQRTSEVLMSRSEFVIYKLKDKEEASEEEIMQICRQFSVLHLDNTEKWEKKPGKPSRQWSDALSDVFIPPLVSNNPFFGEDQLFQGNSSEDGSSHHEDWYSISGTECHSTSSGIATRNGSTDASALEFLFPFYQGDSGVTFLFPLASPYLKMPPNKNWRENCEVTVKQQLTLGELILLRHKLSNRKKSAVVKKKNFSMEFVRKSLLECFALRTSCPKNTASTASS